MTKDETTDLVTELRDVVGALDKGSLEYGACSGSQEALDRSILTILYDHETGRPIAFNALAVMDCTLRGQPVEVLHLGLVVVDPTVQARGFSWVLYGLTTFLLFFKRRLKPMWLSSVTQVPAVVGMVSESFSGVYPTGNPKGRRTYSHVHLVREIMDRYRHVFGVGKDAGFDEKRFVITNAYTGGSDNLKKEFDEATKHRNERYNELCKAQLDYERGDDFIQLGRITLRAFWHFLARSVPKRSGAAVMLRMVYVFLEFLVLPIVQWFSADKPMGELRPWKEDAS